MATDPPNATLPTEGRIVMYRLSPSDVSAIERNRNGIVRARDIRFNTALLGQICPAMVVRTFLGAGYNANLKVFLDGEDDHWVTSAGMGDAEGTWYWPV